MKALLQRVSNACVKIDGVERASIGVGILVFLGVERGDEPHLAERMAEKIVNYRIFEDQSGRMNLSLRDLKGEVLVVSQFTLCANTQKGNRPSFDPAAPPDFFWLLFFPF